eukprot:CAMPEP_0196812856 /NCGR_PEP_ID=MMETSP1362-20130617/31713_1 /TAXON_ID=163516 /ORGANISM="Leptocylindrus danicus, Strain CCMP1856" /LENGTH=503 /DNA_ID=CAMNT_0042188781 /DNA_START=387 /DNA_END=1898 /DNA_ORIENTATION=-
MTNAHNDLSSTESAATDLSNTTKELGAGSSIFWKPDSALPADLLPNSNPFMSALTPRPTAWICVSDEADESSSSSSTGSVSSKDSKIALLEGYNTASDRPPVMIFGTDSIPDDVLEVLKRKKKCSLSLATEVQLDACKKACAKDGAMSGPSFSFSDLGLIPAVRDDGARPPSVSSSPVKLHCSLVEITDLPDNRGLVILEVDTYEIGKEVLSTSGSSKKSSSGGRQVTARVEADLMKPISSLGNGKFGRLEGVYDMYRPSKVTAKDGSISWVNQVFIKSRPRDEQDADEDYLSSLGGSGDAVEFTYLEEEGCILGYNPTKQVILPRPIGWISTYEKNQRIPHVAPYSFFTDVGRGKRPLVAFVSMARRGERKDAQTDSEEMGQFAWNVVTRPLAEQMNYSSADITSAESEFELIGLNDVPAQLIDAPIVEEAPIVFECRYVKTKDVPRHDEANETRWSVVIGEVLGIKIDKDILTDREIDVTKVLPVARMGYAQEYGLVEPCK